MLNRWWLIISIRVLLNIFNNNYFIIFLLCKFDKIEIRNKIKIIIILIYFLNNDFYIIFINEILCFSDSIIISLIYFLKLIINYI